MSYIPVLTHAMERDIDLLLVEELACSPEFVLWLLRQATGRDHRLVDSEVLHSSRRMFNRREIDISLRIRTEAGAFLLLLENKLDADEQPDQARSYRDEAEIRADEGLTVLTGLVAPRAYIRGHATFAGEFDFTVGYEEIETYLAARATAAVPEIGARMRYRARLVRQAIDKERRGYRQVIHPARGAFAERYVALLGEIAPDLIPGPSMLRESAAESVTMIFASETLPQWTFLPRMRIVHQLREGNANLNFYAWGSKFPDLAKAMAPAIEESGFRLEKTVNRRKGGEASVKVAAVTPIIDPFGDFTAQEPSIRAGILAARALLHWLLGHESEIRQWAAIGAA